MAKTIQEYKDLLKSDTLKAQGLINNFETSVKVLENKMRELKNERQNCCTMFETFDQKANQLFNMLSTVLKNMREMESTIVRNIS